MTHAQELIEDMKELCSCSEEQQERGGQPLRCIFCDVREELENAIDGYTRWHNAYMELKYPGTNPTGQLPTCACFAPTVSAGEKTS